MLSREATNTNFIVFGLILLGLEPTIYRTGGKHDNHYTTDLSDLIFGSDPISVPNKIDPWSICEKLDISHFL
jgi:hypothetical protein